MKRNAINIAQNFIQKLWEDYLKRVFYAQKYANLVQSKGGQVIIDHIAFRTLKTHTGEQPDGISDIHHIIKCFGYQPAGKYSFAKKKIDAIHFEHPGKKLPKIFVSQLNVEKLPGWAQQSINETVKDTPYLLSDSGIELLNKLKTDNILPVEAANFLEDDLVKYFIRPWNPPKKETVLQVNDISQYAAWVLLHGNSVNHFAAFINEQNVSEWPDLFSTSKVLAGEGIPMKETIEGENGSLLQQTATQAVKENVEVNGEDGIEKISWTYAYFELTQRGYSEVDGKETLYNGFMEQQARHLFNMTQTRDN